MSDEEPQLTRIQMLMQEREINGYIYKVHPLTSDVGTKALLRLIRALSPIIAAGTKAMPLPGTGAITDALANYLKLQALGSIAEIIPTALKDEDVEYFVNIFGPCTRIGKVTGEGGAVDEGDQWPSLVPKVRIMHFAGAYQDLVSWLTFCIEVNFGGFFDGTKEELGVALPFQKATTPPSRST